MGNGLIPHCPVCQEIDDCGHRLLEWDVTRAEPLRGSMSDFLSRKAAVVERLLVECCLRTVPPRHPDLKEAYEEGLGYVEETRDAAAAHCADAEEWERAYWGATIDREDLRGEMAGRAGDFVLHCLSATPGVTTVHTDEPLTAHLSAWEVVSLFAADPIAVRQHLLDVLAPLEVQLDQFRFERGEDLPQ